MPYKTYIFDLDGTLLDTLQDLANAVNHAMKEMKFPVHTVDEVRNFIGNGMRMLIRRSVPEGTNESDYEKTLEIFSKYYHRHLADFTKPYDGITELLDVLKKKGCHTAVVSNKSHTAAQAVVKYFFGRRFDIVAGKTDSFPAKPEPDSVLYVMDKLKAKKEDCIFIGDSDVDVLTAHNAGLACIGVTWGNRDRKTLEESGADFIADVPSQIAEV